MGLTFTDIFCGAGGSSVGLTGAGLELVTAANHWARAIETHSANFPDAEHLCEDIDKYDLRRLRRTDVLWASPICTEISPAGGRRRTRRKGESAGQLELLEFGPIEQAGFERTRATFHDVIRATEIHRYAAVLVENVVEVATDWELFDWWVQGMCQLRLYLVFTRAGIPLPDVDPRPAAWCSSCVVDVAARQSWKRPGARRIGKYRAQYLYRCPNARCRHQVVEPYVLPAAAVIDWTDLGTRIGDRTRPLAPATLRRIRVGLDRYTVQPYTVPAGGTWRTAPVPVAVPMPTRTARESDGLVVPPLMVNTNHDDTRVYPATVSPLPTRSTKIEDGIATAGQVWMEEPFVTMLRRNADTTPISGPLATLAAAGTHHALTVPPAAVPPGTAAVPPGRGDCALVVPYYRTGLAKPAGRPLDTVTARDRFALVDHTAGSAGDSAKDGRVEVEDCRFRMLQPREHLRAQRFPDTYTVTGNKGEQTMQAGNAVSANVAHWLGQQLARVLQ
jgi:DNA (cytosine-5)-methyltransferase 1